MRRVTRLFHAFCLVVACAWLGGAQLAHAAVVTTLSDSGAGSLRSAVAAAANNEVITFAVSGTITLASPISIPRPLVIQGPGAKVLTISGNNLTELFSILSPVTGTVVFRDLTLANGWANGGMGGAIYAEANLQIEAVQFANNRASQAGGAVAVVNPGTMATNFSVLVADSTFVGNQVTDVAGTGGGAVYIAGSASRASSSSGSEGGVVGTFVQTTFSGNQANASAGMPGGAVSFSTADLTFLSSTLANNHAAAGAGAIHQATAAYSALHLRNSIVSDSIIDAAGVPAMHLDIYIPGGSADPSQGGNVLEHPPLGTCSAGDRCADPLLLGLADNGGPTSTHLFGVGSPAADFLPAAACVDENNQVLTLDQRGAGFTRGEGGACDVGAVDRVSPDLTVSKSHVGTFAQGQLGATYTLTVNNIGPVATSGIVSVTDTLPVGMTAASMSGTGWSCSVGALTCSRIDALAGGASYPPITVAVDVGRRAAASLVNTAQVSGGDEYNTGNNGAQDTTAVTQFADLALTKTHSGNFTQGDTGRTYTIVVTNNGTIATSGTVSLTDTLPTGLTATALSGTGWTCTLGTLTCVRNDSLASGASYPAVTLTVSVAIDAPPSVTNTATVSGGGDGFSDDNTASDPTTITQAADLVLTKSHAGNFAQGQTGATYTLRAHNNGDNATSGTVTVVDTLPAGMTATALSGTGWSCTLATLTCTRSDALAGGASYPDITLTVDVDVAAAASLTNTAAVSGGGELRTDNNTASDPTTIVQVANLQVAISGGGLAQGQVGAVLSVVASNVGPVATTGTVSVQTSVPAGMTPTAISGAGWSCALLTLTCTRTDALASGASYPAIGITVDIDRHAGTPLSVSAVVAGGGEVNTSDNADTRSLGVAQLPDLTIAKSHVDVFTQGATARTYTITVSNVGSAAHTGAVSVSDSLPAGLSATAIAGANWTCTLSPLSCSRADALGAGSSFEPITVTVDVDYTAAASVTNVATVSGANDAFADNNSASDVTAIGQLPDMVLTKTHGAAFTQGQTGATFTLTARNAGSAPTSGVITVVDTLPAGLTATAMAGTGWTCTLATLTCTRSDALAAAASYPAITLTVDVSPSAPASLINTATVSGGGETRTNNNGASDTVAIGAIADLTLGLSHSGSVAQGQAGVAMTATVHNIGQGPTVGAVSVNLTLPTDFSATALAGTGWTCTLATLTCTRSDALAAGANYPDISVTFSVAATAAASLNASGVVSGGGEAITGNNAATDTFAVALRPDLTLSKSHLGSFSQGQSGVEFSLVVHNGGGGASSGSVTVTDTPPPGLTITAMSGMGWTCDLPTLSCARSDVLAAGGDYPAITVTADVAALAAASLINTAHVAGGNELRTDNNTASDSATVTPSPVLHIHIGANGPVRRGMPAEFRVQVSNAGSVTTSLLRNGGAGKVQPAAPGDVSVTIQVPAGLTPQSLSGTGWTCVLATLTCTRNDPLAPGASYPDIVLIALVAENAGSSLTLVATVSGGGSPSGPAQTDSETVNPLASISPETVPLLAPWALIGLGLLLAIGLGAGRSRRRSMP